MGYHRHKHDTTPEFRNAVQTLRELGENESYGNVTRAAGIAVEDNLREAFKQRYGVEKETTGSVCVDRLRGNRCTRHHRDNDHPHHLPHKDHTSLWLRDGEPAVYAAHLYDLPGEYARDILDFADEYGLSVDFDAVLSWYFPMRTTLVAVYTD